MTGTLNPFRDRIINPPSVGGGGSLIVATRSDNSAPAVFADIAARDTYTATTEGTADATRINVSDQDDAREVFAIGTLDGSNNVTSITAAFIRLNDAWVSVATNLVGTPGQNGATGPQGPAGPAGPGVDLTSIGANNVPVLNAAGTDLIDSGIQMLSDGSLLLPENVGAESASIAFGDLVVLREANSFMSITNNQFPDTRFDVIDARRRTNAASNAPRQFFLTEAENAFDLQDVDTATITTNPLTVNYTATLDAQTNAVMFRAASAMTNVRVMVSYADGNGTVIKYLPSKAAWVNQTGGYNFNAGDNTVSFPDSPFRTFVGDNLQIDIQADNVALLGRSTPDEFPYAQLTLQRGEFRDLAFASDVLNTEQVQDLVGAMLVDGTHNGITVQYDDTNGVINLNVTGTTPPVTPDPSVSGFSIPIGATVQTNTDLNQTYQISFTTQQTSQITALNLVVTNGDDVALTVPSSDGSHTQSVTLSGIDTSSAGTVTFQIRGTTSGGQTIMSNVQTVNVRIIQDQEMAYFWTASTANYGVQDLSDPNVQSFDVTQPGTQVQVDFASVPDGHFINAIFPQGRQITSILELPLQTEAINEFALTSNVRTIGGEAFDGRTDQNNAGLSVAFSATITFSG